MILALETATDVCSVVFQDDKGQIFEKRITKHGSHSEKLFVFIHELMNEHHFSIDELETVLVSEGPGSYTGLRIAASAVKGLLLQRNVPLYRANTLASFAMMAADHEVSSTSTIHSIIDARRVHFYHQKFRFAEGCLLSDDQVKVKPIKQMQKQVAKGDIIVGTGSERMDQEISKRVVVIPEERISARSLLQLYQHKHLFINPVKPAEFDPKYYRSNQPG